MRYFGKAALVAATVLAVSMNGGCSRIAPPVAEQASPAIPSASGDQSALIVPGSEADFRTKIGDTVYFSLDSYELDSSGRRDVARQAEWLRRYPNVTLAIEGHADERGTREYNLALGARRANSIREIMISEGVAASRLETSSYGKERPFCTEVAEECWSKNRRGQSAIKAGANS